MASGIPALVKPELLMWARERSAFSLAGAAEKLKVSVERLREWERGERPLSIPQLRKLAELYKRPIAVFFLPEPPKTFDAMRDFRRFASGAGTHSPALELEIRRAHMRRDIAIEIREETDWDVAVFGERIEGAPTDAKELARFAEDCLVLNCAISRK